MPNKFKLWIDKAEDNLKWAKDNLREKNYPLVCYLSQQAAELSIKGYIYSKNEIPPKTHQLIRLSKITKNLGLDLSGSLKEMAKLTEYYIEARYPDELDKKLDKRSVAQEALDSAKKIVETIIKSLPDNPLS